MEHLQGGAEGGGAAGAAILGGNHSAPCLAALAANLSQLLEAVQQRPLSAAAAAPVPAPAASGWGSFFSGVLACAALVLLLWCERRD